jgi:hypothetical protein
VTFGFSTLANIPMNFSERIDSSVMELTLQLGPYDEPSQFLFTWKCIEFTEYSMKVQIYFKNPGLISTGVI